MLTRFSARLHGFRPGHHVYRDPLDVYGVWHDSSTWVPPYRCRCGLWWWLP